MVMVVAVCCCYVEPFNHKIERLCILKENYM
jgi:hypothetical protein